jgi:hypothetical protein
MLSVLSLSMRYICMCEAASNIMVKDPAAETAGRLKLDKQRSIGCV